MALYVLPDPPTFSDPISDDFICNASSSPVMCSAQLGSGGTLRCDFDAFPAATLSIQRPAGSQAVPDMQAATITISGARVEDGGTYTCRAMNSVSTSTRSINLEVGSEF